MKRVIVGGFISLCSAIMLGAMIIAAGAYSSTLTGWSGSSKFWYAIFGSPNEVEPSMNLGILFVVVSLLFVTGVIIMVKELFEKK
jgi:hypothetical protein